MSQNLPVQFTNTIPNLSAELMESFAADHDDMFHDYGGGNLRRLKSRKLDFALIDGSNVESIPADQAIGVIVKSNKFKHCVWYAKDYAPGQDPEAPDLVWIRYTDSTFPDALPAQFRKKVMRNGMERWAFQILHRICIVLARPDGQGGVYLDFARPCIMDLSSMSQFSKDKSLEAQNFYKFGALKGVCAQYSPPGVKITPAFFLTQIVLDPNATVTGPVLFRPMRDATGGIKFLDNDTLLRVRECKDSAVVADMLEIKEKLTYAPAGAPQPTAYVPDVMTTMPHLNTTPPAQTAQQPVMNPAQAAAAATGAPMFNTTPHQPETVVASQPSTPIQMPQQVPDMGGLLGQAHTILTNGAPSATVSTVPPTATAPVTPQTPPQEQAQPQDPTVAASVQGLMAQLNL